MATKRLTLDVGQKFDKLLAEEASASETTKADLIQRAVATYVYLKRQAAEGGKIEVRGADGTSREVVFPELGACPHASEPGTKPALGPPGRPKTVRKPKRTTSTIETNIPPELLAELDEAIQDAINGIYRPEKMEEAARDLEEGREEIRRRLGVTNLAEILTSHGDDDDE